MRDLFKQLLFTGCVIACFLDATVVHAGVFRGGSPDVPLHHWSYAAVERLATAGLIDMSLLGTKPYSRRDFARMTEQAMDRVKQKNYSTLRDTSRLESLLYRLMDEYRPELLHLGMSMLQGDGEKVPRVQYRLSDPTHVDIVGVRTGKPVVGGVINPQRALFDPDGVLLENNNGWRPKDGANIRTRSRLWGEFDPLGAVSVDVATFFASDLQRLQVQEAYARTSLWNLDIVAGREALWWGPGYHGSLLLSDNARPLDQVRLSNRDPFYLPWVFRKIGPMRLNFFMARLDGDRKDFRYPFLNGMRLEVSPAPWLSLGATRTIILGGKGRNPTLSEYFTRILAGSHENAPGKFDPANTDQKGGVDFRLRLPDVSGVVKIFRETEIYGEMANEDAVDLLTSIQTKAFLLGWYVPDLFNLNGLDFRIEAATNVTPGKPNVWYRHSIYTDGYTVDGEIIGHSMGTQADSLFTRLSQNFFDGTELGVNLKFERHGARLANAETLLEGQIDISYPLSETLHMGTFYRLQRYTNAANVAGAKRTNHIFGLVVEKMF